MVRKKMSTPSYTAPTPEPAPEVVEPVVEPKGYVEPAPEVVEQLGWRDTIRTVTENVPVLGKDGRPMQGANGGKVVELKAIEKIIRIRSSLLNAEEAALFDKDGWKPFGDRGDWTRPGYGTSGKRRFVIDADTYEAIYG